MKTLQVHVILLTLTWIHASDLKSSMVLEYTGAEEGNAQLQPNNFVKKYTNDIQSHRRSPRLSTSRNTHILGKPQNDQNVESRPPARRVLKGQRPVPHRKPIVSDISPAQEPNFQSSPLSSTSSINILAGFAGKNRVLVISAPNESDGYYRLMMNLLKPDVYCEMADRHMQQIIMFHEKGKMGGKVRRVSNQGSLVEEPLDPGLVPRLMGFLKMEDGKFGMVLLRKTLQVEERYPYPVQLEAIYEAIDQAPMRRLEKARQKGFVQKCKTAGVEGQVVQSVGSNAVGLQPQVNMAENARRHRVKPVPQPTQITQAQISTTISTTTMTTTTTTLKTTTTKPPTTTTITTTAPTTTTFPSTTTTVTTNLPTTVAQTDPHTTVPERERVYRPSPQNRLRDTTTRLSATSNFYKQHKEKYLDHTQTAISPTTQASTQKPKDKLPVVKHGWSEKLSQRNRERDTQRPTANKPETELLTAQKGKTKPDSADRRKKMDRPEKPLKKIPAGKKDSKVTKETNVSVQNKKAQKPDVFEERAVVDQAANPKKSLEAFLSYFQRRRRLIVITAPDEQNHMYSEQRDEYLEQVCDMALRKISIIIIFGPLTNSTMKIEHYQTEQDKPLRGLPNSDLINQDLIAAFRKHFGMIHNDFNMVLTDVDMKVKQRFEVPIVMKAVFDYIDTLSTRIKEMEQQRKLAVTCKKEDKSRSLEDFLSRFRWRRRLFVISAPSDEEWAYQQQLYAINSQACNLGLRHISLLKLVGKTLDDMSGVLELYPINGSASVDREDLSASLVQDIRNYFQISQEYFSMLLVGKDGNVKSWYPSPMWSMSIIYELVDSMQLRRQEMAIQQSLGMRCPDNDYGHHDGYHEGYHHGYGY
ncbi:coiled-coil domain-containing protein 80 [Garra rufa]|uniref:coiled-coil domain-containing protein 80 n=1 Tax=Garra rufa TaxID=137080 RepID=UPI003CCE7E44